MKNIANADRPKSVGAMLPPRPFRGSGKVAQTACNSDRREGKSCIPTVNQTFADSRILKISKFRTFRIAAQAETLTSQVQPEALLADKGYDADAYIASLRARAIQPVIPPKANRKNKRDCDFALYRERNLVERFFQFIKQFRGIATRYEKTARNFLAGLQLVCALAWLK